MNRFLSPSSGLPKEARQPVTGGSADRLSRLLGLAVLVVLASALIASVTLTPSKRNIEVLAAVIFMGIVLVAHPRKALYFTLLVVPFPAYTSVGSTSSLLIMALAALVLVKSKELAVSSPFSDRSVDAPLLGFALVLVIALYQVPLEYMFRALPKTLGMVSAISLFYVIVMLTQTKQQLFTLIKVVCLAATSLYVIAFLQSIFPDRNILPEFFTFSQKVASMEEIRQGEVRVFATFPGYETFAEYLVITIFLHYMLYRRQHRLNHKLAQLACLLLGLGVLFATGTRAGMILVALGWIVLTVLSRDIVTKKELFQVLFLGFALFYLSLPFLGDYYSLMLERMELLQDMEGRDVATLNSRTYVFEEAWKGIQQRPISGHGFYEYPNMFRGPVTIHIHNLYLTLTYMLGLPGVLFFVGFLFTMGLGAFRAMNDRRVSKELRTVLLFMVTILVMFAVDEMKIEFTRQPLPMHTTFTFFGITVAATRLARREARGEL